MWRSQSDHLLMAIEHNRDLVRQAEASRRSHQLSGSLAAQARTWWIRYVGTFKARVLHGRAAKLPTGGQGRSLSWAIAWRKSEGKGEYEGGMPGTAVKPVLRYPRNSC